MFKRKKIAQAVKNSFKLEALEQRILLSADPVFGPVQAMLQRDDSQDILVDTRDVYVLDEVSENQRNLDVQVEVYDRHTPADSELVVAPGAFDLGHLESFSEILGDGSIVVGADDTLAGSGVAPFDVVVHGKHSPGYSPGVQDIDGDLGYENDALVTIELGGTSAGTGDSFHDQINVSGAVSFGGSLEIDLWQDFVPEAGDEFVLYTFDSASGQFDNATGLFGSAGDLYFDLEQTDTELKLVAREFLPGISAGFSVIDDAVDTGAIADDIGAFLNIDYFNPLGSPGDLSFSGEFDAGLMALSGDFLLQYSETDQSLIIGLDGDIRVGNNLSISGEFGLQRDETGDQLLLVSSDATAVMSAGAYGVGLTGSSFGLVAGPDGLALEASGGLFANLGDQLMLAAEGAALYFNDTGVDWTGTTIEAGGVSYTFNSLAATDRQGVSVTGAALQVSDFIRAEGSFSITSGEESLTLADGQAVSADVLAFGGRGLSGFAGLDGDRAVRTGFSLTDLDLGLALLTDQAATGYSWLALQGLAGGIALEGLPADIVITAEQLKLEINEAFGGAPIIDFKATPLAVATGDDADIVLAFDAAAGPLLRAFGDLNLALAGFFSVSGSFAFERSSAEVRLSDGSDRAVNLMTLGAENVSAFAGVNGQTPEALGLSLEDLEFGLALMSDKANAAQKWLALEGNVASVGLVGIDGLTLSAEALDLAVNRNVSSQGEPVAQEDEQVATELLLETSFVTGSVTLDFLGEAALVGLLKGRSDSSARHKLTQAAEELLKAAATAHRGYSANDVDGQVVVLGNETDGFSLTFGGALAGIDFSDLGVTASEGPAPSLTVVQVGETVARPDLVANLDENLVVDFSASALSVATGTGSAFDLDMDGARGSLLEVSGNISLGLGDAVSLSGNFGFSSSLVGTDQQVLNAIAKDASATLEVGDFGLGATSASLGLVVASEGIALEARGGVFADLGEFAGLSAAEASFFYNNTGQDWTGESLSVGELGYTFGQLDATDLSGVALTGAVLEVGDFARFSGDMAVRDTLETVTVLDQAGNRSELEVSVLSIGGQNLSAFAGLNADSEDRTGLALTDVAFGAAFMASRATGSSESFVAVQASAGMAGLVGVEDLTLSGSSLSVEINRASGDGRLVDFAARNLAVNTSAGTEPSSINLALDATEGELLRARGELALDAFGFLQTSGAFAIEKKLGDLTLADNPATDTDESADVVAVDQLLIGASGLNAFAGINGGKANAIGLALEDVNLALALQTDRSGAARSWTTLEAGVGSAGFVGVEDLTVAVDSLSLAINRSAADGSTADFSDGATELAVLTGPASSQALSLDGSRGEVLEVAGNLSLDVFGFVQVAGGFALTKQSAPLDLTLAGGDEVQAEALLLGASDVRAFAGIDGGSDEAVGLELAGVDLALGLFSDTLDATRSWTSLQASASSAGLIGIDGLTLGGDSLSVEINRAGKAGDAVIDYGLIDPADADRGRATALTVATGPSDSVELTMDGAEGDLLRASGNLALDAFGFFQVRGGFALEQKNASFYLNDGVIVEEGSGETAQAPTEIDARVLTIGGSGLEAFAGVNGGTAEAMGFALEAVDFGLALINEQVAPGATARQFTTLAADAGRVGFVGLDGLSVSAEQLQVEINRGVAGEAGAADVVIDHSFRQLEVLAGAGTTVTLDSDGALGQLTRASGDLSLNLFDFVTLDGNLAFEQSTRTVTLAERDGVAEQVAVDALPVGAASWKPLSALTARIRPRGSGWA